MGNEKCAVIDLGTNTFHLLAIEKQDAGYRRLFKKRIYVKLAEEGIGRIGEKPYVRALEALKVFSDKLQELQIDNVKAFGTAALRTASNGTEFVNRVKEELGLEIELISGAEEARLIHKGVMQAISIRKERILIMDIGGGSVEFIIADENKVFWSGSFPLGVAVLFRTFHNNDPITPDEITQLKKHLELCLPDFLVALGKYPVDILVGASGTFDVLESVLGKGDTNGLSAKIPVSEFFPFYEKLRPTRYEERLTMDEVPDNRADMIIVALELVRYVLGKSQVNEIIVSSYAMKEGILHEMLNVRI